MDLSRQESRLTACIPVRLASGAAMALRIGSAGRESVGGWTAGDPVWTLRLAVAGFREQLPPESCPDRNVGVKGLLMNREVTTAIIVFLVAGTLASTIRFLASRELYGLSGLLVMIPVNTLIGWYLITAKGGAEGLKESIPPSFLGCLLVFAMLATTGGCLYLGIHPGKSIAAGFLVWCLLAALLHFCIHPGTV